MRARWLWALLVSASLATFATAAQPAYAAAVTGPQVGTPAPAFTLKTIDGKTVTLDSFKGKTLVINSWATWCPPCREETPDLLASYAALHASNVVFLGVDSTEEAPIVRAFVASKGIPYVQAIDTGHTYAVAYDIRNFPTTYVIDPQGIVRARYVDTITLVQLRAFVDAAKAGRDGVLASALQTRIDALLAPEQYHLQAGSPTFAESVKKAADAIERAESLMDASDPQHGVVVDLFRTRSEEVVLRDAIIAALEPIVATPADRAMFARLKGDAATEREQWQEAIVHYDEALAIDPKDGDALEGLASAASGAKAYDRVTDADRRLAELAPSPDAFIELGNAYAKTREFDKGAAAFERAVALAKAAIEESSAPKTIRKLGAVYLYQGRMYSVAGNKAKAREAFANLTTTTLRLPKNDVRYAMYLEESQEATVALDIAPGNAAKTAVSLTPWTGADLPGSIGSTLKYRLVVSGAPGKDVMLSTTGLPKGWIASFCTDRVCAPFKVTTQVAASGVKVIEFQLVPDGPNRKVSATVQVNAVGSGSRSSATVVAKGL